VQSVPLSAHLFMRGQASHGIGILVSRLGRYCSCFVPTGENMNSESMKEVRAARLAMVGGPLLTVDHIYNTSGRVCKPPGGKKITFLETFFTSDCFGTLFFEKKFIGIDEILWPQTF